MKTEQEKYFEAKYKAIDFLKALNELQPENKMRLFQELLGVTSMQEIYARLCAMLNHCDKIK